MKARKLSQHLQPQMQFTLAAGLRERERDSERRLLLDLLPRLSLLRLADRVRLRLRLRLLLSERLRIGDLCTRRQPALIQ